MTELLFYLSPPAWVMALLVLPTLALFAFAAYRLPHPSLGARRVLIGLRLALLALVAILILGPHWRHSTTQDEPAPLAILADDSASMHRADVEGQTRLSALKQLLASSWQSTLAERYDLSAYRFADDFQAMPLNGSALTGKGTATSIGQALDSMLTEFRGRSQPDVVLLSDGRSNSGTELTPMAARLAAEGIRVHSVAIGQSQAAPDFTLEPVRLPGRLLVDDDAQMTFRLRARGEALPTQAQVQLLDENGRVLDSTTLPTPNASGTLVHLQARVLEAGARVWLAKVTPAAKETALADNIVSVAIDPQAIRIRVLYVEGNPRWEYRYLKNRLLRANRNLDTHIWLSSASRDFPQECTSGLTPLTRLPTEATNLLDHWDVILLGDAHPETLSADPADGERFLSAVETFVKKGGGLLFLAGPGAGSTALQTGALGDLLPIQLDGHPAPTAPFRAQPAAAGIPHPVSSLALDPEQTRQIWGEQAPLWWAAPSGALRPGARSWLVRTDAMGKEIPVAASHRVPDGWVGWLGVDETWRWRFPQGERQLERFWRSAIRHLASTRLRGTDGRAQLQVDTQEPEVGSFLTVEARLLDPSWEPLQAPDGIPVFHDDLEALLLQPVLDDPGVFRGQLRIMSPGPQSLRLTLNQTPSGETLASAAYTATLTSLENHNTALHAAALQELSQITGGTSVTLAQADALLLRLDGKERIQHVTSREDSPPSPWPLLFVFLLLATLEWALRRRWDLC
mgnify:FL=1|jgi:hypothetical protein